MGSPTYSPSGCRITPHLGPWLRGGAANPDPSLANGLKAEATGEPTSTREMTDTGAWPERNPSAASAATGKAQVDAIVSASVQFIERWKQLRPMGTP